MKCKELQVRDKVALINGIIATIIEVGENYAYAVLNGYETMDPLEFNDQDNHSDGIPITPEILKRNGFDPETFLTAEWERKVYFKEFLGCVVEPADSRKYIFGTTKYWSETYSDGSPKDWGTMYESRIYNLQYVHTLQHALRLVGLSDIADNFKV